MIRFFTHNLSSLTFPKDKILVAVSGGLDSVVLLDLLKKKTVNELGVVHCNFQLRGKASNADEAFVKQLAKSYDLPFFCKRFDTKNEQKASKESIQMTARNLRYSYFSELLTTENYDYIAVAHHADDQIETFFINLFRGAGVKGLRGMLPKRERIIRPLLNFSREDLKNYATKNNLDYREDASNSEDYYLRNAIRHHLVPTLETLDKSAKKGILQSIENLQNLEKQSLQELGILQNCGFSSAQIRNMQQAKETQSGKIFESKTHKATTHKEKLIVEQKKEILNSQFSILNSKIDLIDIENFTLNKSPNIAQLDFEKLQFPLTLRHWKKGDWFVPFGQKGKQKLSDFFINQKLTRFEKERIWLLCSGENIVWIVGYRIDNRFCVSTKTKRILLIS